MGVREVVGAGGVVAADGELDIPVIKPGDGGRGQVCAVRRQFVRHGVAEVGNCLVVHGIKVGRRRLIGRRTGSAVFPAKKVSVSIGCRWWMAAGNPSARREGSPFLTFRIIPSGLFLAGWSVCFEGLLRVMGPLLLVHSAAV